MCRARPGRHPRPMFPPPVTCEPGPVSLGPASQRGVAKPMSIVHGASTGRQTRATTPPKPKPRPSSSSSSSSSPATPRRTPAPAKAISYAPGTGLPASKIRGDAWHCPGCRQQPLSECSCCGAPAVVAIVDEGYSHTVTYCRPCLRVLLAARAECRREGLAATARRGARARKATDTTTTTATTPNVPSAACPATRVPEPAVQAALPFPDKEIAV